jgi:hypothetical protein
LFSEVLKLFNEKSGKRKDKSDAGGKGAEKSIEVS